LDSFFNQCHWIERVSIQNDITQVRLLTDSVDSIQYARITNDWKVNNHDCLSITIGVGADPGSDGTLLAIAWINELPMMERFSFLSNVHPCVFL